MENEPAAKKKKKMKVGAFQGLGLKPTTYKAIMKMGYKVPTPIQRKTIPTILEGHDMVAMARTGSGKTAAFLIPIIEQLASHSVSVGFRAVVLSPTRELAMQTAKFFRQLACFSGLRNCLLVGGQGMEAQFEHLANNPDVIIATPGRLMHHILEAELSLSRVEMLVCDEADRLFELGFAEQLQKILEATPISRQVLLFSATLPSQLVAFSRSGIKNPVFVRLDVDTTLSEQLELRFLYVRKDEKLAAALSVLRRMHNQGKQTIMFVATRHHVEFFGELLTRVGLSNAIVYGSMDQVARTEQISKFRRKNALIFVTTDVAARGIDIPLLDHVLNFDFPPSSKLFVHRSGRTARAGRSGLATSLVTIDDLPYTVELLTFLGNKLCLPNKVTNGTIASGNSVIGAVPFLDSETEMLESLLFEEGSVLCSQYKSMRLSYHLYNKTRPSASKQSVARAKDLLAECGGPAQLQGLLHPAFKHEVQSKTQSSEKPLSAPVSTSDFIQELRGFRPKLEKVGNVITPTSAQTMKQAKLDVAAVSLAKRDSTKHDVHFDMAENDQEDDPLQRPAKIQKTSDASGKPVVLSKPRLSKQQRRQIGKENTAPGGSVSEANLFTGFDVTVDGAGVSSSSTALADLGKKAAKGKVEQFYLSVELDKNSEAKEKGLEMESYQMDLLGDEGSSLSKAKSVMRWDAKKKKFLPVMVSVDGRVVKGSKRTNEAGQRVKGDGEKSDLYKKWSKTTKKRIQKVGELEQGYSDPLGKLAKSAGKTVDFGASADGDAGEGGTDEATERKRKPIVPFHGQIEDKYLTNKQKRMQNKRKKKDQVVGGHAENELKSAHEITKQKRKVEKNKTRQAPEKRKEKAKSAKDRRRAMHEDRQMQYGARTKSRMLIIEGKRTRAGKNRGGKSRFGSI